MRQIIDLFKRPDIFRKVEHNDEDGEIAIHIGGEAKDDNDLSIVQAKVKIPGMEERSIAVVGPKRMDYDKVVSSLE